MELKNCTVHLIHAPKGGCGKTTTAINLAVDLARGEYLRSKIEEFSVSKRGDKTNPKVIIIDADFSGSSLEYAMSGYAPDNMINSEIFTQNDQKIYFSKPFNGKRLYYSDLILKLQPDKFDRFDKYITQVRYKLQKYKYEVDASTDIVEVNASTDIVEVDALFCRRDQDTKSLFAPNTRIGESANVKADLFETFFKRLLKLLAGKYEYDHIVIDLTAGQDQYTNALRNIVAQQDSDFNCFAHILMTIERGSTIDAAEYALDLILKRRITDIAPKVQLIFNERYNITRLKKEIDKKTGEVIHVETQFNYDALRKIIKHHHIQEIKRLIDSRVRDSFYFRFEPFIRCFVCDPFTRTSVPANFIVDGIDERYKLSVDACEYNKRGAVDGTLYGLFTGMNDHFPCKFSDI